MDYEARKHGVTRMIGGDEARKRCPEIQLVRVPERRGKADLTCYREVGAEVIQALSRFTEQLERASIDEAFLDITDLVQERMRGNRGRKVEAHMLPATHVAGCGASREPSSEGGREEVVDQCGSDDARGDSGEEEGGLRNDGRASDGSTVTRADGGSRELVLQSWLEDEGSAEEQSLAVGAVIAAEMRAAVLRDVGCTCSAGIAHNKVSSCTISMATCLHPCPYPQMLAKLAAGMNKPNQQTILPTSSIPAVFSATPLSKL